MSSTTQIDEVTSTSGDQGDRRWYSPEEFLREARRQGAAVSRGVIYEGARTGRLPHIRIGKRILIPSDALDRMLADAAA